MRMYVTRRLFTCEFPHTWHLFGRSCATSWFFVWVAGLQLISGLVTRGFLSQCSSDYSISFYCFHQIKLKIKTEAELLLPNKDLIPVVTSKAFWMQLQPDRLVHWFCVVKFSYVAEIVYILKGDLITLLVLSYIGYNKRAFCQKIFNRTTMKWKVAQF
jgi:hypothetical protein